MAPANEVDLDYELPPNIPTNAIPPTSSAAERGDASGLIAAPATPALGFGRKLTPKGLVKLIGIRFMRTVRRGNLPFLIVFFSCVVYFFAALTGVGYVEPPVEGLAATDPQFKLGQPVFDPKSDSVSLARERQQEALKSLEMEWATKKRPTEGKWMQRARDHGAKKMEPLKLAQLVGGVPAPTPVFGDLSSEGTYADEPELVVFRPKVEKPKGRHGKKQDTSEGEDEVDEVVPAKDSSVTEDDDEAAAVKPGAGKAGLKKQAAEEGEDIIYKDVESRETAASTENDEDEDEGEKQRVKRPLARVMNEKKEVVLPDATEIGDKETVPLAEVAADEIVITGEAMAWQADQAAAAAAADVAGSTPDEEVAL